MQQQAQPDRDWFRQNLSRQNKSQRSVSRELGIDPAAVNKILQGKRRMTLSEAGYFAKLFGVSTDEILRRAGIWDQASGIAEPARTCAVIGRVAGDGSVTLREGEEAGKVDLVPVPFELPADTVAVQFRTAGAGALEVLDGWICYLSPSRDIVMPEAIQRLCLVKTQQGRVGLWFVRRGYRPLAYNLIGMNGAVLPDEPLSWATPIVMMRPAG